MARKKKSIFKTIAVLLLTIISVSVIFYYIDEYLHKAPHIQYPAFGIYIPPMYEIHGIDVSRYQQNINWDDVKAMQVKNIKIGFAFIKATEGVDKVDDRFRKNWLGAEDAEIPKGAYHFFIAGKSGKAQAANFIDIVKLKSGDLPPVLDAEQTYNVPLPQMITEITEWITEVQHYYGVQPILYTNIDFYEKYLQKDFTDYPIWIAHYLQPDKPRIQHDWMFWQHSEKGHVNGIKTFVDFNVFCGDSTAFKNLLIP